MHERYSTLMDFIFLCIVKNFKICSVQHFCIYRNFELFTEKGFNLSSPLQQMPLRVELEGLTTVDSVTGAPLAASGSKYFHHIYDFTDTLPYVVADPTIFLVLFHPKIYKSNFLSTSKTLYMYICTI